MSAPAIPQRPTRSQNIPPSTLNQDPHAPQVPSRPARSLGKSHSPSREFASRSPLNDPPFKSPPSIGSYTDGNLRPADALQHRPSISSLPLIGQEGNEYTSLDHVPRPEKNSEPATPNEAVNIAPDLPLHAPKASVTINQVAPVVRTDTAIAAESGIGKTNAEYNDSYELGLRKTVSRSGAFRPTSSGLSRELTRESSRTSRPASVHDDSDERGIPHFGSFVPMYPNAGDVQAPSPSPYQNHGPAIGVGFYNSDGSRPSTVEGRRKSAAGFHRPADSYGLHGHGVAPQDQFEKEWYKKHPEELRKEEQGAHGPSSDLGRHEWVMSSEDLNRLVHENNERRLGTSEKVIGVPPEAIGYKASEEYTSKNASPSIHPTKSRPESAYASSPLRNASHSGEGEIDNDKIHLDSPKFRGDKYTGAGYDPPTVDLGTDGGNTTAKGSWIDERSTGTPILASDEIQKRPGAEYRQAAISREAAKHGNDEDFSEYDSDTLPAWQRRKRSNSGKNSLKTSRPSSARFHHHDLEMTGMHGTPLNEIEEYEPLFKDGDVEANHPLTAADRLKRPELERRFPSQDIWEDTPNSLQLQTEVSGPQEPDDTPLSAIATTVAAPSTQFELPEKEQARRGEITETERQSFLDDAVKAKPKFNAGIQDEMQRPGMRHRFPSRDIWEDTPDSLRLETTVGPEESYMLSPTGETIATSNHLAQGFAAADRSLGAAQEKPAIPSRPIRTKPAEVPVVPSRPSQRGLQQISPIDKKAPSIPDKPKPQVPSRPVKSSSQDEATDDQSLSRNLSGVSVASPESEAASSPKSKPPVAVKSSKFATIKAGFMENLNSRLQLGPVAPKFAQTEEPSAEEEKAPLADARKSRARGPARRTPKTDSVEEAPTSTAGPSSSDFSWTMVSPRSVWSVGNTDDSILSVKATPAPKLAKTAPADQGEVPAASPLATNTAGEILQSTSDAPKTVQGDLAHSADAQMDERAAADEVVQKENLKAHDNSMIGAVGDVPEPVPQPAIEDFSATKAQQPSDVVIASPEHELSTSSSGLADEGSQTGETKIMSAFGAEGEETHKDNFTAIVDGRRVAGEPVVFKGDDEA